VLLSRSLEAFDVVPRPISGPPGQRIIV